MNINDTVEMATRGYSNNLSNAQRVLVDVYIQCVLEEEHNHDFNKISKLTDMFEAILNELG